MQHFDETMNDSSAADESLLAFQLITASVVPRALKTAIKLNLLELLKSAAAPAVSAAELTAKIQTTNPDAHLMVDRVLRLLAANNILNCTLGNRPDGRGAERLYSLGSLSKFFINDDNGASLVPLLLLNFDRVYTEAMDHLEDAIIEGGTPFDRAHGMNSFEYPAVDPKYNKVFNKAMSDQSTMFMHEILKKYKGFEGVETLVDVGGGTGASLRMILSKHPSIKAINFDLPHVIEHAPSHPGVEHMSGDMFVRVPKADAILLKWICHDWSDEHCMKLLRNCNEAIPETGKVIIADQIVSEIPKNEVSEHIGLVTDLLMLTYNTGGKERTEAEFRALAKAAGFKQFRKLASAFNTWIIELYK